MYNNFEPILLDKIVWMLMLLLLHHQQIPDSSGFEFREKLRTENLKAVLNKACPEMSSTWDSLVAYVETSDHYAKES
jgi:hypothetical protein